MIWFVMGFLLLSLVVGVVLGSMNLSSWPPHVDKNYTILCPTCRSECASFNRYPYTIGASYRCGRCGVEFEVRREG